MENVRSSVGNQSEGGEVMDDRIHATEASDYYEMVMEYFVNKPLYDYVKSCEEYEKRSGNW